MKNIIDIYNDKADVYASHVNKYIIKHIKPDKFVLDVGCASGELGSYLKKHLNCKVYGIDISKKAINIASKKIDKAIVCDIEFDDLPFKKNMFDVIICGDVLEHLYNPNEVLLKLKKYLKSDGRIIISVPNIANIKIRWNLLFGKFDYTKSGILDNTHVRFFTKKTLLEMISFCKINIVKIDYTPGFSFYFLKEKVVKKHASLCILKEWLNRLFPMLTCTQFIVVLNK